MEAALHKGRCNFTRGERDASAHLIQLRRTPRLLSREGYTRAHSHTLAHAHTHTTVHHVVVVGRR